MSAKIEKHGSESESAAPAVADKRRKIEARAEAWGRSLEAKFDRLSRRLPAPLAAVFDALCLGITLLVLGWLAARFGWLPMPTLKTWAIICLAIYMISLAIRLVRKPR